MAVTYLGRGRFRVAVSTALLVTCSALILLPGCGGCTSAPDYPPNLTFPTRADRLVLKLPDKPAPATNDPGKREEEIAALDSLGGKTAVVTGLTAEARGVLDTFLKDTFGTPAAPTIAVTSETVTHLKLTNAHLAEGGKLYRRHCLQCHNMAGDGRGTSGATIPFPRDYRQGQFKFVSSGESGKPRRADLVRTIAEGLKATPMPSFGLLQEGERDLLAGYVTYLAIRGQVEFESLRALAAGEPNDPGARLKAVLAEWEKAESAPPTPTEPDDGPVGGPKHQEAVRRGFALFTAKVDNSCVSCHGEFGRKPVLRYDVWGTVAKPADFTQLTLKSGSRPEDVFARVRGGIPAVGMPAHPKYSDREVWDLVRFVRSAPYMAQLPPDVLSAVYPK
ncbi:Cytochrome c [Gemmata sp. SH-PL17]|uniref:c-type cytochrome n=1 Tax=Gemmata sp. SH-PL17 TaxID=1630693 RepID=UPI00078D49C7|nr:c-type cytochrome [Gemmata sp. SH-PL17]AMV24524.1 Cytochrome c [Gemmata sp. SH-PL17]